jgi:hypothetical protein
MLDLNPKPDIGDPVWDEDRSGVVVERFDMDGESGADDEDVVAVVVEWDDGGWTAMLIDWLRPNWKQ